MNGYNVDTIQRNSPRVREHRGRDTERNQLSMNTKSTPSVCVTCGKPFLFNRHQTTGKYCSLPCWWTHPVEERFWSQVHKSEECWTWQGLVRHDGYGRFRNHRTSTDAAHRFSWVLQYGELPDIDIHHKCGNRLCVNPEHLEALSAAEHTRRHHIWLNPKHNKQKTHCKRGHEFTEENTYRWKGAPGQYRQCKQCIRMHAEIAKQKRRGQF